MSYCKQIVRQSNLTYFATNWTEAKDLFPKIDKRSLKILIYNDSKNFVDTYFNNYFDETWEQKKHQNND